MDKKISLYRIDEKGDPVMGKDGRQVKDTKTTGEWVVELLIEIRELLKDR